MMSCRIRTEIGPSLGVQYKARDQFPERHKNRITPKTPLDSHLTLGVIIKAVGRGWW